MNETQTLEPRLAFRIQCLKTFGCWLVQPTTLTVTCDEFLGNLEEEIVKESLLVHSDKFTLPEVDPDEFERVFQWFQS